MRRVSLGRSSDERGAILVLTAVFAVVMVLMAALVVDIGAMHDERRQLQNGADAAALGLAEVLFKSCPTGPQTGQCTQGLLQVAAQTLANGNALDGKTTTVVVTPDFAKQQITVKTSTKAADDTTILPYFFAKAFTGEPGKTLKAQATATWSGLKRANVVPLAVSQCDFDAATKNATEFNKYQVVTFHTQVNDCGKNPGLDFPGGFGWVVDEDVADCNITLSINDTVAGDTGNPGTPGACVMKTLLDQDVLIPLYDNLFRDKKGKWQYHILGFAQFHLTGYEFPTQKTDDPPCKQGTCIGGYFVKFVPVGEFGGTTNLGQRPVLVK